LRRLTTPPTPSPHNLPLWTRAEWIAGRLIGWTGTPLETRFGAALHFFVYDRLKITVLIAVIAFAMSLVRHALP
jgi:hypothetical protein